MSKKNRDLKKQAYLDRLEDIEDEKWGKRPPSPPLKDIPISTVTEWDDVGRVRTALRKLEQGQFADAAMLVDAMGRDDRIDSCTGQRIHSFLGKPLELEAAGDARRKSKTVKWFEDQWDILLPEHAAFDLMRWGIMLNAGIGELVWKLKEDSWIPTLKVWHPRHLMWRWDTRSYWISTMEGQEEIKPGDGRWLLFMPHGEERGWMGAKVRALAIPFLLRQFTYRDWARYGEVHGLPMRAGIVPANAKDELKQRFVRELANLSTESVIMLPQAADGKGFDLKLIEATALGFETFDRLVEKAEDSIAITLLGQNLTTQVKSGGLGSGGGSQVHQDVRVDLMKADSKTFGQTIHKYMLRPIAAFNFGDPDLAPLPCWEVEPPEDLSEKSQTLLNLGNAVTALQNAGIPVDREELAEEFQVPMLSAEKAAAQHAEDQAKAVDAAAAMTEATAPPGESDPASPSSGKGSLAALSKGNQGFIKGQIYADDVADDHRDLGQKVLAPDLADLLAHVNAATDYEDLRSRLKKAYKAMSANALAEAIRKAVILADLNGRYAVLEDA